MRISVILCTYNRHLYLRKALDSIAGSALAESTDWEVLVIDNNSNDQTPNVVNEFATRYPGRFRYIFEPQQGKSRALNTGIRESRGDVLAFVDDDVTVAPTWLWNLTAGLRNGQWAGAGGRVLPARTFSPPSWLKIESAYAFGPLALFDPRLEAGQLTEAPLGNNMAFRKEMFENYGGFRTDLGPCPGNEIRSEDSEFADRLLAAGERLRYEPSAVVHHVVPDNRVRKKYFSDWWYDKARSEMRTFGVPSDTRWFVAGIPLYLFRRLIVWTLRWMIAVEPAARFECKLKVWQVAGYISECYRSSHGGGKHRRLPNA